MKRHPPSTTAQLPRHRFLWPAIVFLVALVVRTIHVWQIRHTPFFDVLMGDSRGYDEWAQRIAGGDWLGHDVFYQAPLYPYFLGVLYRTAGRSLLIVRLSQAVIGSFACVLLLLAGRRLFSERAGIVAGLILAVYAPAIFFDGLLQKSVLDVFFICLMIWLVAGPIAGARSSRVSWLWLGLAVGGLSLTRENALVFIIVIVAWTLMRRAAAPGERVATARLFATGLALVLLPVAARNEIVGGEFVVTTAQFGPNFFIGNNAKADGTYMSLRDGRGSPEYEREDATELAERASGRHLTAVEVSGYWTDRAAAFITTQPVAWLRLVGRKVVLVWNASEVLDTESQSSQAESSALLRIAGPVGHFGVLVPLAVFGAILTWPRRRTLLVLYAMVTAYAASVVMFYVFARYRYPLVPFLALFAAAGLTAAGEWVRTATASRRGRTLAAVAAAAVFANWPVLSADVMRAVTEANLGVALQAQGRVAEATEHYRRSIALRSDYAPAYNNLGTALRAQGRVDEAVASYEQALRLDPGFPDAEYNLANALLGQGKPEEAAAHFRRALKWISGSADVLNNLAIALANDGHFDEAVEQFQEALRLAPGSAKIHRNLGDALASTGASERAIAELGRAVQLDPADGPARFDLGSILLESRRFEDAAEQFRAVLRVTPSSVEARNNLGIALASQGKLTEAIEQFQQALTLKPDFQDARGNLRMALQSRRTIKDPR